MAGYAAAYPAGTETEQCDGRALLFMLMVCIKLRNLRINCSVLPTANVSNLTFVVVARCNA